jgi:hypothetical protein
MPRPSREDRAEHNARIENALAELNSLAKSNPLKRVKILPVANKWSVDRSTLSRRYKGETCTVEEASSFSIQKLNNMQEEVLLKHINRLSDRGIPPTPQITKNIAEEIAGKELGVHWVTRFVERHRDRLKSTFLCTIDHRRKKADNSHYFQVFFDLVCVLSSCASIACSLLLTSVC